LVTVPNLFHAPVPAPRSNPFGVVGSFFGAALPG
jgi:hypothetical protein